MTAPPPTDHVAVRLSTAAQMFDIPQSTLMHLIREHKLPAYKIGRSYRLKLVDLYALLQAHHAESLTGG